MPTTITSHYATRTGRIVFNVKEGRTHKKLYEYEMAGMKNALRLYRNRVSRFKWNGKSGVYNIAKILDHRKDQRGVTYFLVSWAGAWSEPIWRSEVTLADFETAPTDYMQQMGVEKTEGERQLEKRTRSRN